MASLTLDEVLASVFGSDDNSDYFGHLYSESEKEEDEGYLPAAIQPGDAGSD